MQYSLNFCFTKIACLFFCLTVAPCSLIAQDTVHGTLITILGNRQGIVVVADSMGTDRNGNQLRNPVQKIMQYDDRTVIATAGLLQSGVQVMPNLTTQLLGVIAQYRDNIKAHGVQQSMEDTVQGLVAALSLTMERLANVQAATGVPEDTIGKAFALELRMAGYDVGWKRLIVSVDMGVTPRRLSNGAVIWSTVAGPIHPRQIKDSLEIVPAGLREIEDAMLAHPEQYSDAPIMQEYIKSKKLDDGASLTIEQMKTLGQLFKDRTANVDARVGSKDQIAVIDVGRVEPLDLPGSLLPITKPIPFSTWFCAPGAYILGVGSAGGIVGEDVVFEDCTFKQLRLELDGKAFVHCVFEDTELYYNGGTLVLGDSKIQGGR